MGFMNNRLFSARMPPSRASVILVIALSAPVVRAGDPPTAAGVPSDHESPLSGTDPAVGEARAAFLHGAALARAARWNDAIDAFARSYTLKAHPITTYNLGYCERAVGHYTRAYKMFRRALREHAEGAEGKLPDHLARLAEQYLAEVEHRLARAQVSMASGELRLLVDGRPLEQEPAGEVEASPDSTPMLLSGTSDGGTAETPPAAQFMLLLDPGTHVFVLSSPGVPDTVRTLRFSAGSSTTLELDVERPVSQSPRAIASSAEARDVTRSFPRQWVYASIGFGIAAVTAGGVAGIAAMRKRSSLADKCGPTLDDCPPGTESDIDTLKRYADVSTVTLAVGGVVTAAGLGALFFLRKDGEDRKSVPPSVTSVKLTPSVGLGSIGVAGRF
jgi:hypothetical protein